MKILVLGASQGTGALCVKAALAKGHSVTAFSRTPSKLDVTHDALTKLAGDFHDAESVRKAVAGHDAVIICASPTKLSAIKEKPDYFSRGTKYCIDAMKDNADGSQSNCLADDGARFMNADLCGDNMGSSTDPATAACSHDPLPSELP